MAIVHPWYHDEKFRRIALMRMVHNLNLMLDPKHHQHLDVFNKDVIDMAALVKSLMAKLIAIKEATGLGHIKGGLPEVDRQSVGRVTLEVMAMLMILLNWLQVLDSSDDNGVWLDVHQCRSMGLLAEEYGHACSHLCCPEDEHHARLHWATRNAAAQEIREMLMGNARNPETFPSKETTR